MPGDLTIRKVRTGSGAKAVQVVKYVKRKCFVVRHMGGATTKDELTVLLQEAEIVREQLCAQQSVTMLYFESLEPDDGSIIKTYTRFALECT